MTAPHRFARVSVMAAMASVTVLGLGGITAGTAAASADHHHGCYPKKQCGVAFQPTHPKKGHKVHFESGKAFKPGEKVKERLTCTNGFSKDYGTTHAHSHGRAKDTVFLPKHGPGGTCTLHLTGEHSGHKAKGSFHPKS